MVSVLDVYEEEEPELLISFNRELVQLLLLAIL